MTRRMAMSFLFLAIFLAKAGLSSNVVTEPAVPAVYIFGDSTFDVGTNNFLPDSKSRADMPFYGIDFPNAQPTGRFSNGYNTADAIVMLIGFNESPSPFLYLLRNDTEHFNREILKGVNFASGGSGLLDDTGTKRFNRVISMAEQIQQFSTVHSDISQYINNTAEDRINKSLFLFSVGSNDIFDFFKFDFDPNNTTKVQEFLTNLTSNYQAHLKNLLNMGARKFGILSVPPLGCIPILHPSNASGGLVDEINAFARNFHTALVGVLQNLSSEFPDMKYSLGNSYDITMGMINNSSLFHLKDVTSACCGNATLNGGTPCGPNATVCENRSLFLFWDEYHPTEIASKLAALSLYGGGSEYVAPTNFSQLVLPS